MKTFDEKDLITWANRKEAIIGKEYYFGDDVDALKEAIRQNTVPETLVIIDDSDVACAFAYSDGEDLDYHACILPVDAVTEIAPEKKYRACKTIQEFFNLVSETTDRDHGEMSFESCAFDLISRVIDLNLKDKSSGTEYYSKILSISVDKDNRIKVFIHGCAYSLSDLFNKFEIMINGEWQPFGVKVEDE